MSVQSNVSQIVDVSLRLPSRPQVKSPAFPYGVGDIRFTKQTEVETLPKVGELLTMSAGPLVFPCKVIQRNWDEAKNMFVLACEYGGPSRISNEDYLTIVEAADWTAKALL
jgi:hypothetical protein